MPAKSKAQKINVQSRDGFVGKRLLQEFAMFDFMIANFPQSVAMNRVASVM